MLESFVLDQDQEADAGKCASTTSGASLDTSNPGSGKTAVALRVVELQGAQVVVVVAPLGTRLGWFDTATRMGIDLPFWWVKSGKTGESASLRLRFGEPGIYFIGPEYATALGWDFVTDKNGNRVKNEKGKPIKKRNKFWDGMNPDVLIIDEVHEGATNTRSNRYKIYRSMRAGHIHALSGTPHGNTFDGIYPVTKILWPDYVPATAADFKRKYCETVFDAFAWDRMKVVGEKNPGEYFASLPCVVRREWKYDGEVDERTIHVELSAQQRKAYDELEKNMATMIEGNPYTIDFPATLRVRLRQATLGMFRVEDDGSVGFADDCKSTKLDALLKVLGNDFRGESALIFTDSKRFAYVSAARIPGSEVFSGDQSQKERNAIRERFRTGETKYLVMVVKAGSTGLDGLQLSARNLVWLSRDDSRIKNEQGVARIVRRGQGGMVRIRHIIAANTYDSGILSKHIEDAVAMNRTLKLSGGGNVAFRG